MYRQEMPPIRDAMRNDLDVFVRGVMFAICSIKQSTLTVPDQLAVLFDGAEGESPLFNSKFDAWAYIGDNSKAAALWRDLHNIISTQAWNSLAGSVAAITALLRIPGMGIVKAAFVAQLFGFNIACLDSRNVKREGRKLTEFETRARDKARPEHIARLVTRYVMETHGKAEYYWNAWCQDVTDAYDRTPQEISELHLAILPPSYVPF